MKPAAQIPAAPPDIAQCPWCTSSRVRYSSSLTRHLLRSVLGSRKRCCLRCGRRWRDQARRAKLEEVSPQEARSAVKRSLLSAVISCVFAAVLYLVGPIVRAHQASAQMHVPAAPPYHYFFLHARDPNLPLPTYRYPLLVLRSPRVSSRFGYRRHPILNDSRFHYGMDFPIRRGTPVFAARDGKVVAAGPDGGYGNRVAIRHSDGQSTVYGHLSTIRVAVGQQVLSGSSVIGDAGSTGLSTGPHLHFEIRDGKGNAINPETILGP